MKTPLRKEILKNQFFFDCKCDDCIAENGFSVDETDLFTCVKCRNPFRMDEKERIQKCSSCSQLIEKQLYENLITESKALRNAGRLT